MQKVIIWGTGQVASTVLRQCDISNNYEIVGFIDNDLRKIGTLFAGKPIYTIKVLDEVSPDKIIVLANAYNEIYFQIVKSYPQFEKIIENKYFFYKEKLLQRYEKTKDKEIALILDNIKRNGLNIFNYQFVNKYKEIDAPVYYDVEHGLYYVLHLGKMLYFSKKYDNKEKVLKYYRSILLEQDQESPHRYLSDDFSVADGSVVVDVGAAEGNFAIEVIDKVSKIYLVEADEDWIEALKLTFKDYSDKVIIKKGFVASYNDGDFFTLDSIIDCPVDFIKMDIEGNEWDALLGSEEIIRKSLNIKMAICAYHSDFDQILIEDFMEKHGIDHTVTSGYMWFPEMIRQTYVSTKLNRAIVRGVKGVGLNNCQEATISLNYVVEQIEKEWQKRI